MRIDRTGVTLASYCPRYLFAGRPQCHIAKLKGHVYMLDAMPAQPVPVTTRQELLCPLLAQVSDAAQLQSDVVAAARIVQMGSIAEPALWCEWRGAECMELLAA